MVKFAHLADSHLGSWRQQELQDLNFLSFQKIINIIIEEKLEFVLISGDLFDSAYPPIEILKETFAEFKRLKDAQIPVYLIAGSHDFSASGRTFLDVLEKAGLCKNVEKYEVKENGKIELKPTVHEDIYIYGYSGKKSGMEVEELKNIFYNTNNQKIILMLHTTITDVIGNIDMNSIDKNLLPYAKYYAMGHIHQVFSKEEKGSFFIYPGPTYPNNFQELTDLKYGSFQLTELDDKVKTTNIKIPIKEVVPFEMEIENSLAATEKIIEKINKLNLKDKIFLLKLKGTLKIGKTGDIRFNEIEEFIKKKEAYSYLRNISQLKTKDSELKLISSGIENVDEMEKIIQQQFSKENPNNFNFLLPQLMNTLSLEKNEEEKSNSFENRLIEEIRSTLNLGDKI